MRPALSALLLVVSTLFVGTGCSTRTAPAGPDSHRTLPENLTLTGVVTGNLAEAANAHGVIHAQPVPERGPFAQTSCAEYRIRLIGGSAYMWEARIYGTVSGQTVSVDLSIASDSSTPAKPGDYPLGAGPSLTSVPQVSVAMTTPNGVELDANDLIPAPVANDTLHVDQGMTSGTVSVHLTDVSTHVVLETVQGSWRCA